MHKAALLFGLIVLLVLPACSMRNPEVSQQGVEQRPVGMAPGQGIERQPSATIGQQQPSATAATNEYMGQAPKVEDIPEAITLEAKNGNVTFPHQQHAKMMDCSTCHQGTPGEIPGFGKDQAHTLCKGCHQEKKAGPTKCGDCHKKS